MRVDLIAELYLKPSRVINASFDNEHRSLQSWRRLETDEFVTFSEVILRWIMEHFKFVLIFLGKINIIALKVQKWLHVRYVCTKQVLLVCHHDIYFLAMLFWTAASAQNKLVVGDSQFRYVKLSGDILLNCSTPDNSSIGCRIGWLKGAGSKVGNGSHYTIHCNGSLEIRNVTEELIGLEKPYRCYDSGAVFKDSRSIFIELRSQ